MFIWTIGDAVNVALVVLFVLACLALTAGGFIGRWRCKHDGGARENQACHAICRKCGADLGFIENYRARHPGEDTW